MKGDRFEGGLEGIREDGLAGWAWDPDAPDASVDVEVTVAGQPTVIVRADRFDLALAEGNKGNGNHAFRFLLDRVPSRMPCTVRVRIVGADADLGEVRLETAEQLARVVHPSARLEGHVDGVREGCLVGWVLDRLRPERRLRVVVWDGGQRLLEIPADESRSDLSEAGKGDGQHGFRVPLPVTILDGAMHALSVTVVETEWELSGSPVMFGQAEASDALRILATLHQTIRQLGRESSELRERLDRLERGLPAQPSDGIASELLSHVDGLLVVHRDALEAQISDVRARLGALAAAASSDESASRNDADDSFDDSRISMIRARARGA